MVFKKNQFITCSVSFLMINTSVSADDSLSGTAEETAELSPIVVVASKTPRPVSDVVGQVTVITAQDLQQQMAESLDDVFRYEPGLNMESSGTRFGNTAVNIRGIGGNRVAIEIDGVPLRDGFAVGSYSNGGRALVEPDLIKRVEVLHGPASTLYGSDAIGGVLAVTTWDPDDLLSRSSACDHWYSLRGSYQGRQDSLGLTALGAWGSEQHGLMVSATRRDGHELDNQARSGIANDPQDWSSESYFLRYTRDTAGGHRWRFTIDDFQRDTDTVVNSLPGFGRFRSTTGLVGDDQDKNQRISLDYDFSSTINGVVRLFHTRSETKQLTFEERAAARTPVRLQRFFQYEQNTTGLELNLFKDQLWGQTRHRLGLGLDYQQTDTVEFRDGFQETISDGTISKSVLGEVLPVRDFPNSDITEVGLFIQDEISFAADDRFELIPALRFDRYKLEPKPDAIFTEDNPAIQVVSVSESKVTPRLGLLYKHSQQLSFYGQVVKGFRAPPFSDANIGLDIPLFNIRAIPNPDLKSETSTGIELGLRYIDRDTHFSLAAFDTDYDDFIETRARIGVDPVSGVLLFQSRNINKARIYGAELRWEQGLSVSEDLRFTGAVYWSKGDNRENNQPLNSVSPPQAVLGLTWRADDGAWDAQLSGTFTQKQNRIDETQGERFATPGYGVVDLTVGWFPNQHVELRAGVYNLGDKRYWRWADVSALTPQDPMIELLSRPGRQYAVSARFSW